MTDTTYGNVTIVGGGALQRVGVVPSSGGATQSSGTGPATQAWPDPIPVPPGGDGSVGYLFGQVNPNQIPNVTVVGGAPSVTLFPVAPTSAAGVKNQALIAAGAAVELAIQAVLPSAVQFAGVALTAIVAGGSVQILTQGPLTGFSLGAGAVEAVGTNAGGSLVRASDPACISRLMYMGYCDASGAVYVQPFTRSEFVVNDYGADPTGTSFCDAAFTAVLRIATEGDSILIPQGTFRYQNTFGPLPIGVTVRGVGSEVLVAGTTYLGSVLQYEGVGDAIRVASAININIAGNWLLESFLVRCVNGDNQAPQRQSPSVTLPGAITSIVAAPGTGACRVAMSAPTNLVEGNLVCLSGVTGTVEANNGWAAHIVSPTSFDLVGSTFVHAYTGGGLARMRCGAGVCNIGGGEAVYRNVYATGFGVGFMLDGAETITIDSCQVDGYEGNSGLGSNPTRFSCAVWLTDGDSGCSGWTVAGSTNVITCSKCYFDGARTTFQIDGTAQCNIVSCENPNIGQAGLKNTAITALTNNGGQIEVTAVGNGVLDQQYVGIAGVTGTIAPNANAEWQVQRIDADHFILLGSTFAGAYVSGGVVRAWCPATFARVNRVEQLKFDSCYTEGTGDAVFMFARQTGSTSAQTSLGATIQNHFAACLCPPIYVASNAVDGAAAAVSIQQLILLANGWYAATQSTGGGQATGNYIQIGDTYINPTPGALFWDGEIAATSGVVSYFNSNGNAFVNAIGGLEGNAQLFIFAQDSATPVLRVADNNVADYLRLDVQSAASSSFSRYVNSPGFGDKAGVSEQVRSALLAHNAGSTVIGTSDVIPPESNTLCEIHVVAHRDDDVQAEGAYYVYRAFLGQTLAGSLALIGAATKLDSVVGAGFPAALTIVAAGSTVTVAAAGNTVAASTWQVDFTIENAQRAR